MCFLKLGHSALAQLWRQQQGGPKHPVHAMHTRNFEKFRSIFFKKILRYHSWFFVPIITILQVLKPLKIFWFNQWPQFSRSLSLHYHPIFKKFLSKFHVQLSVHQENSFSQSLSIFSSDLRSANCLKIRFYAKMV